MRGQIEAVRKQAEAEFAIAEAGTPAAPEIEQLRGELGDAKAELERRRAAEGSEPASDAAIEEAFLQAEAAEARATEAKRAQLDAERVARERAEQLVEARTADLRGELESMQTELNRRAKQPAEATGGGDDLTDPERIRAQALERTRIEVDAAREAAQKRYASELRLREQELEREREEKVRIVESSDERLREIERRALAAAERISAAERGLDAEAARLREEGARRIEQEAERARAEATAAASAAIAEREQELERAKAETEQTKAEAERIGREAVERARAEVAAIRSEAEQSAAGASSPELETELAATKRRLEEAIARAEEAERTVATLTDSSREEAAQERELRFQEIEGTIGELEAKANAATEHHVVDPSAPETAAPEPAESPTTEPGPEPRHGGHRFDRRARRRGGGARGTDAGLRPGRRSHAGRRADTPGVGSEPTRVGEPGEPRIGRGRRPDRDRDVGHAGEAGPQLPRGARRLRLR